MKSALAVRHQDRRLKTRHQARSLQVTVSPRGFFRRFRRATAVRCIDINRYGMAIETSKRFRPKEWLSLNFRGRYIAESDILGIIASVTEVNGGFRYGINFAYCTHSKLYSREVDNALSRIESLCSQEEAAAPSAPSRMLFKPFWGI